MRKIILGVLVTFLMACGSTKVERQSKRTIKGDWRLTSIDYDRSGKFKIKLLEDEARACFESSNWQFIPNDNKGTYVISGSGCNEGTRHFRFDIQTVNPETGLYNFMLKPTDEKFKSVTNSGFRMKLYELSETAMQWQQTVKVEGEPFTISMNFKKIE